jgi:iron complex transport system ATP-binding protein
MSDLLSHGYRVTAGVLSTLDTDHETAGYLNVPVVSDPPFSPANEAAHKTNLVLVKRADAVVLTDMQVGWGNIKNLRAALSALKSDIPLVMIEDTPFKQRDFTGGEAEKTLNSLKREGAIIVGGLTEVILAVDKLKEAKASGKKTKKFSKGTRAR